MILGLLVVILPTVAICCLIKLLICVIISLIMKSRENLRNHDGGSNEVTVIAEEDTNIEQGMVTSEEREKSHELLMREQRVKKERNETVPAENIQRMPVQTTPSAYCVVKLEAVRMTNIQRKRHLPINAGEKVIYTTEIDDMAKQPEIVARKSLSTLQNEGVKEKVDLGKSRSKSDCQD